MKRDAEGPIVFRGREFVGFQNAMSRQVEAFDGDVVQEWVRLPLLERALLEDGVSERGDVDVVLIVSDWLPHLIASGGLLDIRDRVDADPPKGWPDAWSPSMRGLQTTAVGGVFGIAYHDGPMMTLYRRDLYQSSQEADAYAQKHGRALLPPSTWDDYFDQARWFTRPEEGLWGTVLAGLPDGHNTVYDFLLHLWSRGGSLSNGEEVLFDSPAGVQSLEFLDRLWRSGSIDPSAHGYDSVASGTAFADGRAATTVNWCGFAALSALPGSPTYGKVGCSQVPAGEGGMGAGVSVNVYWIAAIAAGTRRPDAAYRFLKHLASPDMDKITSEEGATGTRLSTWRDPEMRRHAPYYQALEGVHRSVQSPPNSQHWPQVTAVLNDMVAAVLNQSVAPAAAAKLAGDRVRRAGWLS